MLCADLDTLGAAVQADPNLVVTVDLVAREVRAGSIVAKVTMLESARQSLTTGQWDFLGQLLDNKAGIAATAAKLPYLNHFAAS